MHRHDAEGFSFALINHAKISLADARRVLQHCLKYRLQRARRAADDFQHIGSRGLLLEKVAQLVEQARVLDGDDGLGGEIRKQLDLACE